MRTIKGRRALASLVASAVTLPMALALSVPAQATDTNTAELLQAMVAEEKVAHDVYVTLGDMYGVSTFARIAASETRHQEAVRKLLATYGVADPTVGDAVGEFDDPVFQKMYDEMVAQGSTSLDAAADVGMTIEQIDITDLQQALDAGQPADITRVFTNLLNGSQRHLAAFTSLADGNVDGQGQGGYGRQNGFGKGRWN